jgi:hypothetical protein
MGGGLHIHGEGPEAGGKPEVYAAIALIFAIQVHGEVKDRREQVFSFHADRMGVVAQFAVLGTHRSFAAVGFF